VAVVVMAAQTNSSDFVIGNLIIDM
jgi:hypothetical protein